MFKKMLFLLLALMLPIFVFAQSSGKIMGIVTDKETGEPLPGVNIVLQGTNLGGTSDVDGYFVVLNVPVGAYSLEASYIGYTTMIIENIRVSAGVTTEQNISLQPTTLELGEAVVVTADRPLVEKHVTQSVSKVTSEDLETIPVRGLQNLIGLQASVVIQDGNVHIRGGRAEEVGYYLDGASTVNPMNRLNNVHVIQEAVEEVQVLTGGYTAEYGDANAGIVRSELKTGGSDYSFSLDAQTDKFVSEGDQFLDTYSYRDHVIAATASGPITNDIRFFIAYENEDIGDTQKRFSEGFNFTEENLSGPLVDRNPSNPRNNAESSIYDPDTLSALVYPDGFTPDNWHKRHTINSTLLYDLESFKFRLSAVYTYDEQFATTNPTINILNTRQRPWVGNNLLLTGKFTHVLNPTTYYELKLNYYLDKWETEDDWFGTDWRSWRDSSKVAEHTNGAVTYRNAWDPDYDYLINGFDFRRDGTPVSSWYQIDYQTYYGGALDFVTQATKNHELKAGVDARLYTIRNYDIFASIMKQVETYGGEDQVPDAILAEYLGNNFGYDEWGNEIDSGFDGPKQPVFLAAYVQDKIEYKDLIINAGLRFDYFDSKDRKLKNPANPVIDQEKSIVDPDEWVEKDPFLYLSPRLGISFPVSEKTVFYTQYGKFVQMPEFNDFYNSSREYGRQIGGGYFYLSPLGFDMEPIRTTSYEIGFRQQVSDNAAIDVTGFYKNVKGQVQVDRIVPDAGATIQSYNYLTNGDFATTKGLEFKLTLRRINRIQAMLNYTYTDAEGTGSGETSYFSPVDQISQRPTRLNPLDYNQTHRGSINLDYRFGKDDGGVVLEQLGVNMIYSFNSGHPFTLVSAAPGQSDQIDVGVDYMNDTRSRRALEGVNSSTTPWYHEVDLRVDKSFNITEKLMATIYVRVNNLLNTKNVINVFEATGSAQNDGFLDGTISEAVRDSYINAYGEDYVEMYKAINLDNGQAYWSVLNRQLYSNPRQVLLGLKVSF
ncbi:MAG: TonB-dependent receptor [Calditrichaceae bacterium]|nr:TonB-dependent receptor [Calditrichaceae bacterium]